MSAPAKKPPPAPGTGRRTSTDPAFNPISPARGPSRSPTPSSAPNGIVRTRSIRGGAPVSARAAMQRPGTGASTLSHNNTSDADDAHAETVALLDELKDRLRITELKSEQFQRHAEVLQSRLDDAIKEQGKLEDRLHESDERLEILENEKRDTARQIREMESIYEAERMAMNREKDEMAIREEEMQTVIQRLKDSLSQRLNFDEETRVSRHSNNSSPSLDGSHFAPSSALNRSDSRNNSKLLLQKDRLIESLRLELAEAQIKLVETENMGGGRLQEVERLLLEARMTNARLMEDNESFQLLLSEKTLNGDFTKNDFGYMGSSANEDALNALEGRTMTSSLADELSEAAEGESDNYRRLEAELKSSKDQNKALTLYINKIIERLLMHQDFEAILDQSSEFKPGAGGNTNKELPPPPQKDAGPSILQRAKSVALGGGRTRPRPMSQMPASHSALTDPDTAPSIPFGLNRSSSTRTGGGRPKSEQFTGGGAASVVNRMYSGGPVSPTLVGTPAHNSSFFAPPVSGGNPNAAARYPSGGQVPMTGTFPGGKTSENSSTSGDDVTTPGNSPPRAEKPAVSFGGNKPRPLRLVQENPETARKLSDSIAEDNKAKRGSWMGWAGSLVGKKEESTPEVIRE